MHSVHCSIEACSGNLSKIKLRSGLTSGQVSAKVQKLIERKGLLNRNVENFLKIFNLAMAVQEIIRQHPNAFNELKFLEKKVRKKNPQLNFSFSNLYRVFRMQGFRWKKKIFRVNQTGKTKDARCHFMREVVLVFRDTFVEVYYFDWISFSQQNFPARSCSGSGEKSIVTDSYPYS